MPKISVVIPMYNSAHTIERTLVSITNQTFQDFQVIIVDDGSTDNSVEIAQRFIASRDNWIVVQQTNAGPSRARNHGMDLSDGEYIAFLDSDDEWLPHKTALQLQYLEANPDIWLIGAPTPPIQHNRIITFTELLARNYFQTSSVLMRNVTDYRFNESQKYSEDYRLWLTIAHSHKCGLIGGEMIIYDGGNPQNRRTGLSTRKWAMEKGELSNFSYLFHNGMINLFTFCFCSLISCAKFVKRLVL